MDIINVMLLRIFFIIAFIVLFIISLVLITKDVDNKKMKLRTVIVTIVCFILMFLLFFAGNYMIPRFQKQNIKQATDRIINTMQENKWFQKEVTIDGFTVNVQYIRRPSTESLDERMEREFNFIEKHLLSKFGKDGDIDYFFRYVSCDRDVEYLGIPDNTNGCIYLQNESCEIFIDYSYTGSNNSFFEQVIFSIVGPYYIHRDKFDIMNVADALGNA